MLEASPRARIVAALAGEAPALAPVTMYDGLFPPGFDPRRLQAKGLGIAARRDVVQAAMPNVRVRRVAEGRRERTVYETPVGTLTELHEVGAYGARAPIEHPIKQRDDYRVALFMVDDTCYAPAYDGFLAEEARLGDSAYVYGHSKYSPLIEIQLRWLGQEAFCFGIYEDEDALMDLYEHIARKDREMYRIVAAGPARHVLYGGNIVPAMVGPERIRQFVLPCWRAFADALHGAGKALGVHLDADNRLIMDLIAESPLDFIEAFTPPPDCSVSVAEARAAWPGKRLWLNFPSSVMVAPPEEVRAATLRILEEAGSREGFLIGVTEDIPAECLDRSLGAVLDAVREYCGG